MLKYKCFNFCHKFVLLLPMVAFALEVVQSLLAVQTLVALSRILCGTERSDLASLDSTVSHQCSPLVIIHRNRKVFRIKRKTENIAV